MHLIVHQYIQMAKRLCTFAVENNSKWEMYFSLSVVDVQCMQGQAKDLISEAMVGQKIIEFKES